MNTSRNQLLRQLCKALEIRFANIQLLDQALTHTSFANESKNAVEHNERLEFLGDAILDFTIGDYLFRRFPALPEGELTKFRAIVVCEPTLADCAAKLGIGHYLLLGKGEANSGGRQRVSILADAFEAVIGAIYLDQGINAAFDFILRHLQAPLALLERGEYVRDYKTLLQEVVQRNSDSKIVYEVVDEKGPDHDKTFEITVLVNGRSLGVGQGRSKKEAEQVAAREALVCLNSVK